MPKHEKSKVYEYCIKLLKYLIFYNISIRLEFLRRYFVLCFKIRRKKQIHRKCKCKSQHTLNPISNAQRQSKNSSRNQFHEKLKNTTKILNQINIEIENKIQILDTKIILDKDIYIYTIKVTNIIIELQTLLYNNMTSYEDKNLIVVEEKWH